MASSKEVDQLRKKLQLQKFTERRTSRGHYQIRKGGRVVTVLPGTPSDHRTLKNCIADLRREGFQP